MNPWLWPVLAGSGTFLVAGAIIFLVVSQVQTSRGPKATQPVYQVADVESRVQTARKAVADGDLARAAQELEAAQDMLRTQPDLLSAADARRLTQLQRQVAIVADWEREPLEHLLRRIGAAQLNEREWQALMARYRGKAVIFDRELRRDLNKQVHVEGNKSIRLDLQSLKLLDRLPLTEPQRVLFAARLADIKREPDAVYRILLEPDSGVLLTDADIASKCFLQPLDEPMQEVIKKQAAWAAQGP